ncbi:MAG: Fic family protein [Firmicutes bacterium]|nr:Fic family protein [Bacillota bacterium]
MELIKALKWVLLSELRNRYRGGIYGYTQRTLAFNSNKIEGSTLTEEQTTALFEEGYLPASGGVYRSKDVEETTGHFLMFNKMLETLDQELSEDLIKSFHYELKAGVFEDRANGYAIGDYKKRPNTVGGIRTALPEKVSDEMQGLLTWYNQSESWDLKALAVFHSKYETIHPFQDGNGRTGRLILFRECLRHNCTPFIIHDNNRSRYIEALKQAHDNQNYFLLANLFKEEQEDYEEELKYFDVEGAYEDYLHANPAMMTP